MSMWWFQVSSTHIHEKNMESSPSYLKFHDLGSVFPMMACCTSYWMMVIPMLVSLFLDNEAMLPSTVPMSKFGHVVVEINTHVIHLEGCNQSLDDVYHLWAIMFTKFTSNLTYPHVWYNEIKLF